MGIELGWLAFWYQPERDIRTGVVVAFGALLSACAGSLPVRLAYITPERSASSPLRVNSISGSNEICRWESHARSPLRVWIEPQTEQAPLGADSIAESMVERAFHAWDTSEIPVRVSFVRTRTDADVEVTFLDRFSNINDGYTVVTWDSRGTITHGVVQLALHTPGGQILSDSMRLAIATHEAGHALGLGHSRDTADVMSPQIHVMHPSAADFAMLRLIYLGEHDTEPIGRVAVVTSR